MEPVVYPFYIEQCVFVNPQLLIYPWPLPHIPFGNHKFVFYVCKVHLKKCKSKENANQIQFLSYLPPAMLPPRIKPQALPWPTAWACSAPALLSAPPPPPPDSVVRLCSAHITFFPHRAIAHAVVCLEHDGFSRWASELPRDSAECSSNAASAGKPLDSTGQVGYF